MAQPDEKELRYHVDEIGYSLVSIGQALAPQQGLRPSGRRRCGTGGVRRSVLHVRAIVEFLGRTGSHIHASHYCPGWDGFGAAKARGFDLEALSNDLNMHAAHLSRRRYKVTPGPAYDLVPRIQGLLELFRDFLACPNVTLQNEFGKHFTEAQLHLVRVSKI